MAAVNPTPRSKRLEWAELRLDVLPRLSINILLSRFPSYWVDSRELFNKSTLPESVTLKSFATGFWSTGHHHEIQGTFVYEIEIDRGWCVLLRPTA